MMRDKVNEGDREAWIAPSLLSLLPPLHSTFLLTWTRLAAGARRGTAEAAMAVAGAEGRTAVAERAAKRELIAR